MFTVFFPSGRPHARCSTTRQVYPRLVFCRTGKGATRLGRSKSPFPTPNHRSGLATGLSAEIGKLFNQDALLRLATATTESRAWVGAFLPHLPLPLCISRCFFRCDLPMLVCSPYLLYPHFKRSIKNWNMIANARLSKGSSRQKKKEKKKEKIEWAKHSSYRVISQARFLANEKKRISSAQSLDQFCVLPWLSVAATRQSTVGMFRRMSERNGEKGS